MKAKKSYLICVSNLLLLLQCDTAALCYQDVCLQQWHTFDVFKDDYLQLIFGVIIVIILILIVINCDYCDYDCVSF